MEAYNEEFQNSTANFAESTENVERLNFSANSERPTENVGRTSFSTSSIGRKKKIRSPLRRDEESSLIQERKDGRETPELQASSSGEKTARYTSRILYGKEDIDCNDLTDENWEDAQIQHQLMKKYEPLVQEEFRFLAAGQLNGLREYTDEFGATPAPMNYPKVPRRSRRGTHYQRILSVMTSTQREIALCGQVMQPVLGDFEFTLGQRTRALLARCVQIVKETEAANKKVIFPKKSDRKKVGWDSSVMSETLSKTVKNSSVLGRGVVEFHEKVRDAVDRCCRGIKLLQRKDRNHPQIEPLLRQTQTGLKICLKPARCQNA